MNKELKNYLVEFIGTFFLVLVVISTAYFAQSYAAFAIAAVLMVMVYAGGHISGGHYNPAVSLAAAIRGALPCKEFAAYSVFQIFAGIIAVYSFKCIVGCCGFSLPASDFCLKGLLFAEFLFTFALCYVVLQCATTKSTAGNSYYGLAIGFTVLAGALAVGGTLCAGAFNPAVALALVCTKSITLLAAGWTILANLLGAAAAALIFKLTYNED